MASVSQWEREAIGERTREALQHKKMLGGRVGNVAYGFRLADDGRLLEPEPDEQRTLDAIRADRTAGYTLRAITSRLNLRGSVTRRGGAWRHTYVANLLRA